MYVLVSVCLKKEIYKRRVARVKERQESACKRACILSLCGLCCSDKFRVCPDFFESPIPKTPPGDSEHPVPTQTTVTKGCLQTRTRPHTNRLQGWPNLRHMGKPFPVNTHINTTTQNPNHIIDTQAVSWTWITPQLGVNHQASGASSAPLGIGLGLVWD